MKKKRFTEEQIVGILQEAEKGKPYQEISREHGVHVVTISAWKRKYAGLVTGDLQKLKTLEDENRRLKYIVADQSLEIRVLKELNEKKW